MSKFYYAIILIFVLVPTKKYFVNSFNNDLTLNKYGLVSTWRVFFATAPLVIISGFRVTFIDTTAYRLMYRASRENMEYVLSQTDKGFFIYMYILNFISNNSQFLMFVSTVLVTYFIVDTILKFSSDPKMSLFLYVATGSYAISMNGLRQFMAISLLFYTLRYIKREEKVKTVLCAIIATSFHFSAILFVLSYRILKMKAFTRRNLFVVATVFFAIYISTSYSPLLMTLLGGTHYDVYITDFLSGKSGAGFIRVIVEAVPVLLACYCYFKSKKIQFNNKLLSFYINCSMINLIAYIVSLQAWIFARIGLYFQIYNILMIPLLLDSFFNVKERVFLKYIVYLLYTVYFVYQMKYAYSIELFELNFKLF